MAETDLADRAREVIRQMDGRTPPFDLDADLGTIDAVLAAPGAERLSAQLVVILLGHRGNTLVAAGRGEDAADAYAQAVERFGDVPDPATAHQLDLVRMHLADTLISTLHRIDEGEAMALELLGRFERNADDRYLPYKGLMLMDLTHLLFAVGRHDAANATGESVLRRLESRDDEMSRSVAAECRFYLVNLIARQGEPTGAAGHAEALLNAGQPALEGFERIANRFGQDEGLNPDWRFQVEMLRDMVLMQDEPREQTHRHIGELRRRAERAGVPDELRAQLEDLAQELDDADDDNFTA